MTAGRGLLARYGGVGTWRIVEGRGRVAFGKSAVGLALTAAAQLTRRLFRR